MHYEKPIIETQTKAVEGERPLDQAGANAVLVAVAAADVGTWVVACTQAKNKFRKDWFVRRNQRAALQVVALPPSEQEELPSRRRSGLVQLHRHSGGIR